MPDPSSEILFKAEDAVSNHLSTISANLQGCSIYLGGGNDESQIPWIGVIAASAQERQPRGKGNYGVTVNIEINTSSNDFGRSSRRLIAKEVSNLFSNDGIISSLSSAIDDFRCFGFLIGEPSQRIEGRRHVYTIPMLLVCCGSDA